MSVIKVLVLGAFKRRGVAHGYRIYRDLVEWRVDTWTTVRPGSIYHAISQFETKGLILASPTEPAQKLGPAKTEYELTSRGEQEFIHTLEAALKDINLIKLSAGIAFMEYLPRKRVIELLQQRLIAQQQIPAFLKTLPTEVNPSTPSKHPELIRIWADTYTDAAASTKKLIIAIQSGMYVFKNEEVKT
ncbi:MAG TPA: PadR family transcriptional regulator [Magnetospirillaceae bacterium]|nr:PadR family transcriptional regulator [Magnetospirillaceae bacterium]